MKRFLSLLAVAGATLTIGWQAALAQTPTPCTDPYDRACNTPLASMAPDAWLTTAANTLGLPVATIYGGAQRLSNLAAQQTIAETQLKLALYNTKKQQIVSALRGGSITITQARQMIRTARTAASNFVANDINGLLTNVDVQRATWQAQNIQNYRFRLTRSCYCFNLPPYVTVVVQNGVATDVTPPPDWVPELMSINPDQPNTPYVMSAAEKQPYLLSFEDLFRLIEDAEQYPAYSILAQYNTQYGYPTQISVDYEQMMADEEMFYTISNFEILP